MTSWIRLPLTSVAIASNGALRKSCVVGHWFSGIFHWKSRSMGQNPSPGSACCALIPAGKPWLRIFLVRRRFGYRFATPNSPTVACTHSSVTLIPRKSRNSSWIPIRRLLAISDLMIRLIRVVRLSTSADDAILETKSIFLSQSPLPSRGLPLLQPCWPCRNSHYTVKHLTFSTICDTMVVCGTRRTGYSPLNKHIAITNR